MKRWGVTLAALVLPLMTAISVQQPVAASTTDNEAPAATATAAPTLSRLAGSDRYATSVAISKHEFATAGSAHAVYLARGDIFADALAAGALTDGPVLLVPTCGTVPASVKAEVSRLDPDVVYALGGTDSVCPSMLNAAAGGRPTDRLTGDDRAATAAAIAQHAFPDGAPVVYLATGATSPDPIAGGVLSDGPILLTSRAGTTLPAVTAEAIATLDPTTVVALGGKSSVSTEVLLQAGAGRERERVAGDDRYSTSVAIAQRAFPSGTNRVYLARGDGTHFSDAVVAGVLTDGPVVLTRGVCDWMPRSVTRYLHATTPTRIVALGGASTLCDTVLRQGQRAADTTPAPNCAVVKCVALTFDDGPGPRTLELVNILLENDVDATFFMVGQQVAERPITAKRVAMEGFQVEDHTWSHPELPPLTRSQQLSQFTRTADVLEAQGIPTIDMLRPPYGAYDSDTRSLGVPLILWSVDSLDWKTRNAAAIRAEISNDVSNGAIVLQHDIVSQTVDATPYVIADLRARGYHFVTIDQLVPSAGPGDLVFSRTEIRRAGTASDPNADVIINGTDLGIVRDDFEPLLTTPSGD